jgi:hypothetical protein
VAYQAPAQLSAQKQNYQPHPPFVPSKVASESQNALEELTLGNYAATQL